MQKHEAEDKTQPVICVRGKTINWYQARKVVSWIYSRFDRFLSFPLGPIYLKESCSVQLR